MGLAAPALGLEDAVVVGGSSHSSWQGWRHRRDPPPPPTGSSATGFGIPTLCRHGRVLPLPPPW